MKKVLHKAPKVKAIHKDDKTPDPSTEEERDALDTRIALIQALIPLGLDAVAEELQSEVTRLAGDRYSRKAHSKPQSSVGQSTRLCVSGRSKSASSLCRGCVMWSGMRKSPFLPTIISRFPDVWMKACCFV